MLNREGFINYIDDISNIQLDIMEFKQSHLIWTLD
jgi:hypothetical protein